jgi:hypothetical protein
MVVSVTRLHLRSKWYWLPFAIRSMRGAMQARRSGGFRGGALGNDEQGGNWTITQWADAAAMRAFRNAGAHMTAMPKLLDWCDEASFAHYECDDDELPTPSVAYQRLAAGRISKVNHPSAQHAAGRTVSDGTPRFSLRLRPR